MSEKPGACSPSCVLRQIDLATGNMDKMLDFYRKVFGVDFRETSHGRWMLHIGQLGDVELCLAPDQATGMDCRGGGVHQFHVEVPNRAAMLSMAEGLGAKTQHSPDQEEACVWDPDGNPWMLASGRGSENSR